LNEIGEEAFIQEIKNKMQDEMNFKSIADTKETMVRKQIFLNEEQFQKLIGAHRIFVNG